MYVEELRPVPKQAEASSNEVTTGEGEGDGVMPWETVGTGVPRDDAGREGGDDVDLRGRDDDGLEKETEAGEISAPVDALYHHIVDPASSRTHLATMWVNTRVLHCEPPPVIHRRQLGAGVLKLCSMSD